MTSPGVRERLAHAAFELFDERGYEQTTVDHIAERAGVGRTTFFRHFPSKEDVIFPDHDAVRKAIQERLAASTHETALVAVAEAARLVLRHYLAEGARARSRYQLTSRVSTLRDREIASVPHYQRQFRAFIHDWMGGEPQTALRAELMAAAVVTAHNVILRSWLQGNTEQPEADFDQAMEQVFALYSDTTAQDVTHARSSILVLITPQDLDALLPKLRKALREP
jgi:AcrR family transcriptional regulator